MGSTGNPSEGAPMSPHTIDRLERGLKWLGLLLALLALGVIGGYLFATLAQDVSPFLRGG